MIKEEELRVEYEKLLNADEEIFRTIGEKIRLKLLPKPGIDYSIDFSKRPKLRENEKFIAYTFSICPDCFTLLIGLIFERDKKIWIRKICPNHGEIEEIYWGDADLYYRFRTMQYDGKGVYNPQVPLMQLCPFNCGLCGRHKSHSALVNLVATNRCDLSCWYCFFFASKAGYVYEPTLEHIRYMIHSLTKIIPVNVKAVQITGGEPLLRKDIIDIIKLIKEFRIRHVQVNTTGIKLAFNPDLAVKLRQAGTNVLYVSFDGVTPYTNPKNHWEIPLILENCRKAHLGIVLVPTLIRGHNDHELGLMIKFAAKHMDIVRGLNIQPVSITGRVPRKDRLKERITIPEAIILIEKQTDGEIYRDAWYPVPSVYPVSHFIEAITGKAQLAFTTHFACGAATYVFKDGDKLIPITDFIDVKSFFSYLEEKANEIEREKNKYYVMLKILAKINGFINWGKVPSRFKSKRKLLGLLYKIFIKHDYDALGEFHYETLFLGMMHFQDRYNHDVARVQRCSIHYISPDGRLIPFCSFNVLPELYRDRVQKVYGIPIKKWEKISGVKLAQIKYRRKLRKLLENPMYRNAYEGIIDLNRYSYEDHKMASLKFGIPVEE